MGDVGTFVTLLDI